MDFRPKQYYEVARSVPMAPVEEEGSVTKVYFRNQDGSLGQMNADDDVCKTHKDAILLVKEALVAEGDCLSNKAVLAVIEGGKQ